MSRHGILHSFSRKGYPYDNACIESFHSVMKKEDIYLHTYQDFREARRAILEYIEGWYNRKRIHSAIGYMIPQQKEEELKRQNKLSTFCVQSIDISPLIF
ncbi:integrase core domain-containing protein [Enterocloster clostridioformis]|uniref:integrase core domain-containing protein n=1 Tax=Enterocloster clostridioformis TaxID=1531 RepID=UPI001FBBABBC|nr:integrase core domain-containing protein [Enterocloster clostridioformis]